MGKAKLNPATGKMQPTGDYRVGYARTPVNTRFKPGQCGYLPGRPKGKRNMKTELKEIAQKKVDFIDNGKKRKISLVAANLLAHGAKGAKGDTRSAALFLNQARAMGLLGPEESEHNNLQTLNGMPQSRTSRPSELLFQNLDLDLLSREEQVDLSRLAEVIDLGGDLTALSGADFERVKFILNKGRGKDVTPK